MAYFVRNLQGIKKGGQKITIKLDLEKFNVKLYKKNDSESFSFCSSKKEQVNIYVDNYEGEVVIPSSGFWQIAIKSSDSFSNLQFLEEDY